MSAKLGVWRNAVVCSETLLRHLLAQKVRAGDAAAAEEKQVGNSDVAKNEVLLRPLSCCLQ